MNDVTQWRDATTYSRDDQECKPTCYEIKHGYLRIYITSGHVLHRPNYVLHCYAVGIDTKPITVLGRKFNRDDKLDDVKARAIEIVESRIDEIRDDIIVIKREAVKKECQTCKHDGMQLVARECQECNTTTPSGFKNWESRE